VGAGLRPLIVVLFGIVRAGSMQLGMTVGEFRNVVVDLAEAAVDGDLTPTRRAGVLDPWLAIPGCDMRDPFGADDGSSTAVAVLDQVWTSSGRRVEGGS
jgi:hypothetical protein